MKLKGSICTCLGDRKAVQPDFYMYLPTGEGDSLVTTEVLLSASEIYCVLLGPKL